MTFTSHGTKDICKHCGKEIIYDADDGYWDNILPTGNRTPFNCLETGEVFHEPTNHMRNIRGFYCTNESLK